ncbi:hypothetical protein PYCC9005_001908 [Savitreella phatthalungensis]
MDDYVDLATLMPAVAHLRRNQKENEVRALALLKYVQLEQSGLVLEVQVVGK